MLEEHDMKMLHMNAPLGCWREWSTLTYDHNVLADWLARENEDLRKIKKELETKSRCSHHRILLLSVPVVIHIITGQEG